MIRAYCVDDITARFNEGYYPNNEPKPVLEVEMKAYVNWKSHLVRNVEGEQVISRGIIYVKYNRNFTHEDKIYNINGDGIEYAILDIRQGKDFSENHQELHIA